MEISCDILGVICKCFMGIFKCFYNCVCCSCDAVDNCCCG